MTDSFVMTENIKEIPLFSFVMISFVMTNKQTDRQTDRQTLPICCRIHSHSCPVAKYPLASSMHSFMQLTVPARESPPPKTIFGPPLMVKNDFNPKVGQIFTENLYFGGH